MTLEKEIKTNFISRHQKTSYLKDSDKYLSKIEEPQYKFNIIGSGMIGQEHMRTTMMEGRATVHGIYDTSSQSLINAKEMFESTFQNNSLVIYGSLEDACNDPEVDALIICTPNYTHIEIIREATKSGKHIMLEKPMATTLKDAYEITEIAKNHNAIFQIGLQYRYKAIYVEAIEEALERKAVGEIKTISILEHRIPFLDKVNQWNKFSKYSGGTLVEKCCHYFDLLNLFAQAKPVSVYATGSMAVNFKNFEYEHEKSDILDNASVTVVYENGITASFNLCMFAPMFNEELIVCGDEGRLKASELEDFIPIERPKTYLEIMRSKGRPSKIMNPCYPTHIEESGHNGATYYEHIYFVDNIEGKQTNTATTEEGFWSVVVGVAAEESIKTGQIVNIDKLLKDNQISFK